MSTQNRMTLCLMVTKLSTLVDLREDYPIVFRSQGQGQSTGLHHCPLNILWSICLIITKQGTVAATRKWIIHYIYMQPFWILLQGAFMFLKHFLFYIKMGHLNCVKCENRNNPYIPLKQFYWTFLSVRFLGPVLPFLLPIWFTMRILPNALKS